MARPHLAFPLAGLVALTLAAGIGVWRQSAARTTISAVGFEATKPARGEPTEAHSPPQDEARSPQAEAKPGAARRDPGTRGEEATRPAGLPASAEGAEAAPAIPAEAELAPAVPAEAAPAKGKGDPTDPSQRFCATYRFKRMQAYLKQQEAQSAAAP